MTEKLPCDACGELILTSTADKSDGLCLPCKTGYREEIERKKFLRGAELKYLNTPVGKHWKNLANQVYEFPGSFYLFSPTNQTLFSVGILKMNVCNGGFIQYFSRNAADYCVSAILGLMEMGATQSLRIVMCAKKIYFGAESMPLSEETRKVILSKLELSEDQINKIKMLDENFRQLTDELQERTAKFMEKHEIHSQP